MIIRCNELKDIIGYYGESHQIVKAIEELSELSVVLAQTQTKGYEPDMVHITEEIADVYVMLKQLEMIFCLDDRDIQPIIDTKIERTLECIKK